MDALPFLLQPQLSCRANSGIENMFYPREYYASDRVGSPHREPVGGALGAGSGAVAEDGESPRQVVFQGESSKAGVGRGVDPHVLCLHRFALRAGPRLYVLPHFSLNFHIFSLKKIRHTERFQD